MQALLLKIGAASKADSQETRPNCDSHSSFPASHSVFTNAFLMQTACGKLLDGMPCDAGGLGDAERYGTTRSVSCAIFILFMVIMFRLLLLRGDGRHDTTGQLHLSNITQKWFREMAAGQRLGPPLAVVVDPLLVRRSRLICHASMPMDLRRFNGLVNVFDPQTATLFCKWAARSMGWAWRHAAAWTRIHQKCATCLKRWDVVVAMEPVDSKAMPRQRRHSNGCVCPGVVRLRSELGGASA